VPAHEPQIEVLFIDMDAFFASCEQLDHPELAGKPVGVTPVLAPSGCCIATSYAARAKGVKTGCRVSEAQRLCPEIEIVAARPYRYIQLHHQIMAAIDTVLPVSSVDSIDECWIQLLGDEREPARAEQLARDIKRAVHRDVGPIGCSVGIAPNRLLAKVAASYRKPDNLMTILRRELPGPLLTLEPTDLPGINKGIRRRLRVHGIHTVEDLYRATRPDLKKAWGSVLGEYWWHWLRGDHARLPSTRRRTVGHQHVLAPEFRTGDHPLGVAHRLMAKAAQRLRSLGYVATRVSVSLALADDARGGSGGGRWSDWSPVDATSDTMVLSGVMRDLWKSAPRGSVLQVGVRLEGLQPEQAQMSLFSQVDPRPELMRAIDRINDTYGSDTVYLAPMHHERKSAPRRIPFGPPPSLDLPDIDHTIQPGESRDNPSPIEVRKRQRRERRARGA